MANHKSAEKRARQTITKTKRHNSVKSSVKTFEKKLVTGIEAKAKDLNKLLSDYVAQAMSSVNKGTFKKETISRKIGRLTARVQKTLKSLS